MIPHLAQTALEWIDLPRYDPRETSQSRFRAWIGFVHAMQLGGFTAIRDRRESRQRLHRDRRRLAEMAQARRARRTSRARRWKEAGR